MLYLYLLVACGAPAELAEPEVIVDQWWGVPSLPGYEDLGSACGYLETGGRAMGKVERWGDDLFTAQWEPCGDYCVRIHSGLLTLAKLEIIPDEAGAWTVEGQGEAVVASPGCSLFPSDG